MPRAFTLERRSLRRGGATCCDPVRPLPAEERFPASIPNGSNGRGVPARSRRPGVWAISAVSADHQTGECALRADIKLSPAALYACYPARSGRSAKARFPPN